MQIRKVPLGFFTTTMLETQGVGSVTGARIPSLCNRSNSSLSWGLWELFLEGEQQG